MISCSIPSTETPDSTNQEQTTNKIIEYYNENKGNDEPSVSHGTVSGGSIENSKLIPFEGNNYKYFDTISYLSGRAFMHSKVKSTLLNCYSELEKVNPDRIYYVMECSNQNGGKMFPHRTHQNGLSVDLMMPLVKDDKPCYEYDKLGVQHYLMEFDYEGKLMEDPSISIDFETIAQHLLLLEESARNNGLKIKKIIIHTELKDELFSGKYGQQLKQSDIYVVKALTPLINALHDDHYHVDFELL